VRNVTLHRLLESFAVDASSRLCAEAASGAEMPFELAEERGSGRVTLYCYRPLVDEFIRSRMPALAELPSHADAAHALARCQALDVYLSEHGVKAPSGPRGMADAALGVFLESVFIERSGFGFEPASFEAAYADLERSIYEGHCTATIIAPVLGVALDPDTIELSLGDGLSLIRGDALADAPPEAVWGEGDEPNVIALLAISDRSSERAPLAMARALGEYGSVVFISGNMPMRRGSAAHVGAIPRTNQSTRNVRNTDIFVTSSLMREIRWPVHL